MTAKIQDLPSKNTQLTDRSTRLLLALWFSGGKNVNQGDITKRIKLSNEKSNECQKFFDELDKEKAIEVTNKKVSLTEQGKSILGQSLRSTHLDIQGTVVGSWMAKALLQWIQQEEAVGIAPATNGKVSNGAIASCEEFKPIALETFDRLNREHNLNNLVPIYRIRREIGDRVSRSEFNDWMLELQASDVLQLIGGEMPSLTPDKAEDSIETKLGGVRYYVKLL